jgi:GT2 family glycosyltransferase
MKLGVVVLNWNGIEVTPNCLESLYASTHVPDEIVVVDNASRDHSPELIRTSFPDATFIQNAENLGFSGGCNIGIRYLLEKDFDLILLLNNDAEVAPDCLEKLIGATTTIDATAYTGTIYESAATSRIWYSGGTVNMLTLDARHTLKPPLPNALPHPTEFISGCCLLMTAGALRDIGLLDETFFAYYEDLDWCLRARRAGRELVYVPQSIIYHNVSQTFKWAGTKK